MKKYMWHCPGDHGATEKVRSFYANDDDCPGDDGSTPAPE